MEDVQLAYFQEQLLERRQQLQNVAGQFAGSAEILRLVGEVDSALKRINQGTYGVCEVCHESMSRGRLVSDPCVKFCLECLNAAQREALEQDLRLASRIQTRLLPKQEVRAGCWEACYGYQPLGPVSGDYCDLIPVNGDELFFAVGDVSGKGVAASLLVSHLHAVFRTLAALKVPVTAMVEQANRLLCETGLESHFATLACGVASRDGDIEICNAGHCTPLVVTAKTVKELDPTGVPLGLFCDSRYSSERFSISPSGLLLLYTDGLTEATSSTAEEYGKERLSGMIARRQAPDPLGILSEVISDMETFTAGAERNDDLAVMVLQRRGPS